MIRKYPLNPNINRSECLKVYITTALCGLLPLPELNAEGFFTICVYVNNNKCSPYLQNRNEVSEKTLPSRDET